MPTEKEKFNILGETPYSEWPDLLMPSEIAALFRVDPKTVGRWGNNPKKIPADQIVRTIGKHKRFKKQHVYFMYTGEKAPDADADTEVEETS